MKGLKEHLIWNTVFTQNLNTYIYSYRKISTETAIFIPAMHEKQTWNLLKFA